MDASDWHITPDFDQRTVFANGELAEAAAEAVRQSDDTLSVGWCPERKGLRWAYVVVRRRGTHELIGYVGPGAAP